MAKITCSILTYNEESRIRTALDHSTEWADEVLVLDKSSTDSTREIAKAAGARVVDIGFSRQGEEDVRKLVGFPEHDWIWGFTPGEVPTKAVVDKAKKIINSPAAQCIDIIRVPIRFLTFGKLHPSLGQPWSLGNQGRIFNRKKAQFRHLVHAHYIPTKDTVSIAFDDDTYVLHPTHVDARNFLKSSTDYVFAESSQRDDHKRRAVEALELADRYDELWLKLGDTGLEEKAAWKSYHYMLALACLNRGREFAAEELYAQLRRNLVDAHWKKSEG
jgi:glycosyltransferase involved in cell wall biosynthesis